MLPIFKEYITFLKTKTDGLDFLEEGIYWYDRSMIKAFSTSGDLVKIARIYVDDNLDITVKGYEVKEELETWQDTVKRYKDRLREIECNSLDLIQESIDKYQREVIVLSSGGKDSAIVTHLVKRCVGNPLVMFNNTSLDCADTYLYIKQEPNLLLTNPSEGFYQYRKRLNFVPTRFGRVCCRIFKEGNMIENLDDDKDYLFFMGMRNQESAKRSTYGDEWKNEKWGKRNWDAILPIREWSELEVWLYILQENIRINTKYKKGYSRVGCAIACPFYTKTTWVLDKYWYPKAFERWQRILVNDFRENNKDIIMNCTEQEYLTCWNGGVFRDEPTEEVIKEFAERNDLDEGVAENYFNHKCKECGKRIKSKEVLGMNMKLNGRNVENMYCKKHLKEILNIDNKEWDKMVEDFKDQDCKLF